MTDIQIFYDGPIVNRAEAKATGSVNYFTGDPCVNGHICQRNTKAKTCLRCNKIAYHKKRGTLSDYLQKSNPLREITSSEFYGHSIEMEIKNRTQALADGDVYYFTGKPCARGHVNIRFSSSGACIDCAMIHKENLKASDPDYDRRLYLRNRDKALTRAKKYKKDHPDRRAEYQRRRRARKMGADGCHTKEDVAKILELQKNKCAEPTCRKDITERYHVDHIMPLSLGGSDWPDNLQCLCPSCNTRKRAKHPLDWAKENGRLL